VHPWEGLHGALSVQPQTEASASDLRLLYQWLTSTSATLAASHTHTHEAEGYWHDAFPQIGLAHNFVM